VITAAGVFVTILDRHYHVAGTDAAMMMAPRRAGAQHVGYTDWRIGWSFTSRETEGRHVVSAARVDVVVTRTLPRWRPPATAEPALVARWNDFVEAIARHEQGHVDLVVSGARSLHEAIVGLAPIELREALHRRVAALVEAAFATIHAADLDYDEATQHGALQGVRLPW
jgi:predicted secreted Zn-dependent protease